MHARSTFWRSLRGVSAVPILLRVFENLPEYKGSSWRGELECARATKNISGGCA